MSHSTPLVVCVVSHTHWDREWYHPLPRFRQRLVALIDALLADDGGGPFLLDGQAITLLDYLTVRPERFERLAAALRDGCLEAGPWFVLADNLIPGGEAIVRNLEAGRRVLGRFGARAPQVAYCPDTFGHPAALPQIAAGFGLPVAVVWRGAGGASLPPTDAFEWRGPDGASVFVHHLPPDGYEFGSALPVEAMAAAERWGRLQDLFAQRNRTGVVLLLNGADHHARQPDLAVALAALRRAAGAAESAGVMETATAAVTTLQSTTLQTWADRFHEAAARCAQAGVLPRVAGELRDSYGYTWTLGGTLATRAHQKRHNARLERGLLRDVEPWLALAVLHDRLGAHRAVSPSARLTMAQLPALLDTAWESLLAMHPHDTLCGCSVDAVARAMDVAQEGVAEQGRGLREAALQLALEHDVVDARSRALTPGEAPVVIRNRAARARGGLTHLTLRTTIADVPVGPASADARTPELPDNLLRELPLDLPRDLPRDLLVPRTGTLIVQPLGSPRLAWERRESPQHYPDNDLVVEQRMLAWMPEVPAMGLRVGHLDPMSLDTIPNDAAPLPVQVKEDGERTRLDNGCVRVDVTRDGIVTIATPQRTLHDALRVESCADTGDSYTPSPGVSVRLAVRAVRIRERGPLRAAVDIVWTLGDGSAPGTPRGAIRVTTTLRVNAGSDVVECRVHMHNQRTDHRTRLVWHTDIHDGDVLADAAFGPVVRAPILPSSHAREGVPDGMPLHRWLLQHTRTRGAALLSDGLAEGYVADGKLGVTLLRAIGELSRSSIPERPGHAGWPASTPDAQCQGEYTARVALLLIDDMNELVPAGLAQASDDLLLPLMGETWRDLRMSAVEHETIGDTSLLLAGPSLHGDGLDVSAVTISRHDPAAVILRAVNCLDRDVAGTWRLPFPGPWAATPCRLDETPIGEAMLCEQDMSFSTGPRGIVTFLVRRAPESTL
ncbi:glycoside hydrolase family 38 C-terminal domain-containing protein [Gemmatimonas aurantiaca]|uniref:glycoside hydrolase family 38 N-terminal domain-containing protein n=1 Tax=Gemmatimonas aurantiaca TaxID=173480 RepID=UPI00301CA6AB